MTALQAAVKASEAILEIYQNEVVAVQKEDGSPVTVADITSSKIIAEMLSATGIPLIGEEEEIAPYEERQYWKENWCVDPLDGTRMFLRRNDEFAVNIAHIIEGKSVFGIIASPVQKRVLLGGPSTGVFVTTFDNINDSEKWQAISSRDRLKNPVTVTCSRSYTHGSGFKYMQQLERQFGELVYIYKGSALKFFDLTEGRAEVYPRFAPTMEWDIAAGQAILEALGGTVVTVKDNQPLRYNKESLFNPHFIAKTKALLKA
ncbi:MAG: 3'(2'),5'-bisphosphate nucleotidase CysQ [bacterium]|nr:3'(2'),5'-bisphosphate nucleotidase CysQ [bacterium]